MHHLTFAFRQLRKSPGFTISVVLTLALGLGVNTALFSWLNAAALRPLPVAQPEQLYTINRANTEGQTSKSMSYSDFVDFRDGSTVFSGLTASMRIRAALVDHGEFASPSGEESTGIKLETVSTNYFAVFGVPMALARSLAPEDETSTGALPVIVLSHQFWSDQLGGDPEVIGRKLRLSGLSSESLTVVGVADSKFFGTMPIAPAGWTPLSMRSGQDWRMNLNARGYTLVGRLRADITRQKAEQQLQAVVLRSAATTTQSSQPAPTITLDSSARYVNLTANTLTSLAPIIGLFAAVLIISCANATSLMLSRSVTRQFEFGIRCALGASKRNLFAQLMTENLILGLLGGAVGLLVSGAVINVGIRLFVDMVPDARSVMAGLVYPVKQYVTYSAFPALF